MKTIGIIFIFVSVALWWLTGCKSPTVIDSVYSNQAFEIECLGIDLDGSQTLRSWGKGKDKAQAMENARKNAVKAVLFEGILNGDKGCDQRPIIGGANAYEKNQVYFNRFFADGGEYKIFTSMEDEKRTSRIKSSDKSIENWGAVVRVDRAALRQRMIDDGIINP